MNIRLTLYRLINVDVIADSANWPYNTVTDKNTISIIFSRSSDCTGADRDYSRATFQTRVITITDTDHLSATGVTAHAVITHDNNLVDRTISNQRVHTARTKHYDIIATVP